jgi:hypothetical protein
MPKNEFGPNLVLNRVTNTGFNIAGAPASPPTDATGSADTTVDGSLAITSLGMFQRVATVWTALSSTANNVTGRFITGTVAFTGTASAASVTSPFGATDGDRVFITPNEAVVNTNAAVVMYSAEITGGNVVITALDNAGAAQATAGLPSIFYMIDTST